MDHTAALQRALTCAVGRAHVLDTSADLSGYAVDWTGRYRGRPRLVVAPGSAEEVAAVLAACRTHEAGVVPQGGNTGLVGGSVPLHGEVVLSMRRFTAAPVVDEVAGTLTVGAGVPLDVVHDVAARAGFAYGVDLASRGSATVGGTIATNAGGLRVMRYGDTRAQVIGVEAVLGDGTIVRHLDIPARDNTGYHLPGLLCGSEGTLGIVTAATLRLHPRPQRRYVVLLGLPGSTEAVAAAAAARRIPGVSAVEYMQARGLDLVASVLGVNPPLAGHAAYLLVEATDGPEPEDLVLALPGVADAAVGDDARSLPGLWRWRERHTEAINTRGAPVKMDVTLPLRRLAEFLQRVDAVVQGAASGADTWLFGHLADGNVHVNVTGAGLEGVEDAVFTYVAGLGGSIATEHGIGTAKRRWLPLMRTPEELRVFAALKAACDPAGLLNPHVLLP